MTSVLLQPRRDGVDGAGFFRISNFSPVVNAGYEWISFYLGGNFGISSKQIEAAWAVGLPIMLNFEREANAALGGYPRGKLHAETAIRQAKELGFVGEAPLIFSGADFGPTSSQYALLDGYHRALTDVFAPVNWVGGAYGPRAYLVHLREQSWWPENWPLWHWGGDGYVIYDWAWCKQWYGKNPHWQPPHDNSKIGTAVDENTLLIAMKFWNGYGPDHLDPDVEPGRPKDMILNPFVCAPQDVQVWFSYDGVTRRRILDPLDLRSTAAQAGVITLDQAWNPDPNIQLDDAELRSKVVAVLGDSSHLKYFGVDVDQFKDAGGAAPIRGIRIASVPGDAVAF